MTKDEKIASLASVLISAVDILKEEGLANAGSVDGLLAYQVLGDIIGQANGYGIPLAEIGLEGFDLDALINPPKKAA